MAVHRNGSTKNSSGEMTKNNCEVTKNSNGGGTKNSFGEMKEQLISVISGLEGNARALGMESDCQSFSELKDRVIDGKLKVIVIGEFNRGKSTFINALLGNNVLPNEDVKHIFCN